jgi:thiol-disulfide isomerase/thioredoxin
MLQGVMTRLKLPSAHAILGVAFLASLLLFGCREGDSAGSAPNLVGTKPTFQLQTLEGRPVGPKDFPGQVVVVDFWATWCGPCHVQARILGDVYKDYRGKGVQFLAADVGEEAQTVKSFLKTTPVPYSVVLDPKNVSDQLGVYALPTLLVVNKKGVISFFQPGIADGPTIRRVLKEAGA